MEGKRKRRIMPCLVATTSALACIMCVRTHYVRTNYRKATIIKIQDCDFSGHGFKAKTILSTVWDKKQTFAEQFQFDIQFRIALFKRSFNAKTVIFQAKLQLSIKYQPKKCHYSLFLEKQTVHYSYGQ